MLNRILKRQAMTIVVASTLVGLAGCQIGSESSTTPTTIATPTSIPMLTVLTPTPGGVPVQTETPPAESGEPAATEAMNTETGAGAGAEGEPEAETESTPETATNDGTYIVEAGDTLYSIAVRFNVSMEALSQANGIADPSTIQVGQVLVIP